MTWPRSLALRLALAAGLWVAGGLGAVAWLVTDIAVRQIGATFDARLSGLLDAAVAAAVTDAEGRFSFDPAPPGRLEILQLIPDSMERGSWTSRTIHGLELQPGQSVSLELKPDRPDEEQGSRSSRRDELWGFMLGVMGAVPVIVGFLTVRGFIRRRRQVGS